MSEQLGEDYELLSTNLDLIPPEVIYGIESMVVSLVKADFNESITVASRLHSLFDAKDPFVDWYAAEILLNNNDATPAKRIEILKSILKSDAYPEDAYTKEGFYNLQIALRIRAIHKLLVLLDRAKWTLEKKSGTPFVLQISQNTLRELILELSGINTRTDYSTLVYNSILLNVLWTITNGYDKSVASLIDLAFRHHRVSWQLVHWGDSYKFSEWTELKVKYEVIFDVLYKALKDELQPKLSQFSFTQTPTNVEYQLPQKWFDRISQNPTKLPSAFWVVHQDFWQSGHPPRSGVIMLLQPKFSLLPSGNEAQINTIFGATGSGKTVLENALAVARVDHGAFGVRLELDQFDRLQPQLMATPLHPSHPAAKWVFEVERLPPRAIDVVSLVVVTSDSDLKRIASPPLKIDKIVYVEDPKAFDLPWNQIYKRGRLVCFRFVNDTVTRKVLRTALKSFTAWRKVNTDKPAFIQIEEALTFAPSRPEAGRGADSLRLSQTTDVLFRNIRGLGCPLDLCTQRPADVIKSSRTELTDLFVSNLGEEDTEEVIKMLPSGVDKKLARSLMLEGRLSHDAKIKWFIWVSKRFDAMTCIRAVVPPCGAEVSTMRREELFKFGGILADSWDEVVRLNQRPLPVVEDYLDEVELEARRKARAKEMQIIDSDAQPITIPRRVSNVDVDEL